MDGEENEQMGVGEDWVCFDVGKEYGGEEDEILRPHRPEERYGEKTGHCWWITTGDRSGKMATNHQSHSSADSATCLQRDKERERERERGGPTCRPI